MNLRVLEEAFTVCKVESLEHADFTKPFCFLAHTDEELSLVCPTHRVPAVTLAREDGWRGIRIEGVLDFSLVGILARIASLMAENRIAIFAVSTYNTDYVFMKENDFECALKILCTNGYQMA